jgi:hypothetical protein
MAFWLGGIGAAALPRDPGLATCPAFVRQRRARENERERAHLRAAGCTAFIVFRRMAGRMGEVDLALV